MGIIFVAGCYGVGKSTLLEKLSEETKIPHFSAGMLISENNQELYGPNKYVADKKSNQAILIEQIEQKLKNFPQFFLDGHFCIFKKGNIPDILPLDDLAQMHFEKIFLLEAAPSQILKNLKKRDGKNYSLASIEALIMAENKQAYIFSEATHIPLYVHHMHFDDTDVLQVRSNI